MPAKLVVLTIDSLNRLAIFDLKGSEKNNKDAEVDKVAKIGQDEFLMIQTEEPDELRVYQVLEDVTKDQVTFFQVPESISADPENNKYAFIGM